MNTSAIRHLASLAVTVILLSCFDGIATAATCIAQLPVKILAFFAWEIDPHCCKITSYWHPVVQHRGDFTKDNIEDLCDLITAADPKKRAILLSSAGPPCPDFSRIRGESAPGRKGVEGAKFDQYCDFLEHIESKLQRRVYKITENVVMAPNEAAHFSKRLKCEPILVDACDFGIIRRPRLWWTTIDWNIFPEIRYTFQQQHWRVYVPDAKHDILTIDTGSLKFSDAVMCGKTYMPCLTTPSPTDAGRDAPAKSIGKCDAETVKRWQNDNRRFAPWHYAADHMLTDNNGVLHVPSACIKEQMHMLPMHYTDDADLSDRDRHRIIGNGWHFGVAKFLFVYVLLSAARDAEARLPYSPRRRPLEEAADMFLNKNIPWTLRAHERQTEPLFEHTDDPSLHLLRALSAVHPNRQPVPLDFTSEYAVITSVDIGDRAHEWRQLLLSDLRDVRDELIDASTEWYDCLPRHVQLAYGSRPAHTQIILFVYLLRLMHYPGTDVLFNELTYGFPMMGALTRGTGWQTRIDGKYQNPCTAENFRVNNNIYAQKICHRQHSHEHWQKMLDEILTDVDNNRMAGPFRGPQHWPVATVAVPGRPDLPLRDLPCQEPAVAIAFPIIQIGSDGNDKVRRGEDWRRSHHNATIHAYDAPHHHTIDCYVQQAMYIHRLRRQRGLPCTLRTWGHDHEGAYRQLPVSNPNDAYVMMHTPSGPTLWNHHVLLFGAVSSVWAYNRFGDAMVAIARILFLISAMHYVDDFGSTDHESCAIPAFALFATVNEILGLRMKASKAAPAEKLQRVLGVHIRCTEHGIFLSPTPNRVRRVMATIDSALTRNLLTPDQAAALAGKLAFLCTTMFGRCGRALLKPIYARQHSDQASHLTNNKLTHALRAALIAAKHVVVHCPPRYIAFQPNNDRCGVIYADAFFDLGDRRFKPTSTDIPTEWQPRQCPDYHNGWGSVVFLAEIQTQHLRKLYKTEAITIRGEVPPRVLEKFCSRRAYIYFLEAWAQVITNLAFSHLLGDKPIQFVDNEAAKFALTKGYGADPNINSLLSLFWSHQASTGQDPWFERVSSAANISDSVSRDDMSEANAAGWLYIDLDLEYIWDIIIRCVHDPEYASSTAHSDCVTILRPQVDIALHGVPETQSSMPAPTEGER